MLRFISARMRQESGLWINGGITTRSPGFQVGSFVSKVGTQMAVFPIPPIMGMRFLSLNNGNGFIMKNPSIKIILVAALLLPLTNAVNATETLLSCPAKISVESFQIQPPLPEWHGLIEWPLRVRGAGFMAGEPATRTHLKHTSETETKEKLILTWKFVGDYPDGKWLSCNYSNGVISFSKRIDDHFSECSVSYRKNKKGKNDYELKEELEKISCK